jgi:hypothetical protein
LVVIALEMRESLGKPKSAPRIANRAGQCVHLGEPTGRTVGCETCTGNISLKVLACAVHGECTVGKRVDGVACCSDRKAGRCPDFAAAETRLVGKRTNPEPARPQEECPHFAALTAHRKVALGLSPGRNYGMCAMEHGKNGVVCTCVECKGCKDRPVNS